MSLAALVFALSLSASVVATPLPDTARAEVSAVLDRLASSGCQFERNGTWYSGAQAKAHLLKKLDYIEGKAELQSAEEFIDKAASSSSLSGKAYQVRCATGAPGESGPWLRAQLKDVRAKAGMKRE